MLWTIERQCVDRRSTGGGEAHDFFASPTEVMIPPLVAGVEEFDCEVGRRITRRLPCSFAQRAMNAGQCQIGECRDTSGSHRHDMIEVKRGCLPEV